MWARFQAWKNIVLPVVFGATVILMNVSPEGSTGWYLGIGLALTMGLVYIIGEIVGNLKGRGHPCGKCGKTIVIKSFSVRSACPACGGQL